MSQNNLRIDTALEIGQLGVCDEIRTIVSTSESEVVEALIDMIHNSVIELTLRLKKAAGPDQINNRLLKNLPERRLCI
jgi:hypothetical protein